MCFLLVNTSMFTLGEIAFADQGSHALPESVSLLIKYKVFLPFPYL